MGEEVVLCVLVTMLSAQMLRAVAAPLRRAYVTESFAQELNKINVNPMFREYIAPLKNAAEQLNTKPAALTEFKHQLKALGLDVDTAPPEQLDYEYYRDKVPQLPGEEHIVDECKREMDQLQALYDECAKYKQEADESSKDFCKRVFPIGRILDLVNPDVPRRKEVEEAINDDLDEITELYEHYPIVMEETIQTLKAQIEEDEAEKKMLEEKLNSTIEEFQFLLTRPMDELAERYPTIAQEVRDELSESDWSTDLEYRPSLAPGA